MLGRKDFTQDEIDAARGAVDSQLAAYDKVAKAVGQKAALEAFEPLFFNALLLALDRPFVHRVRQVAGKDGNALNEVELVVESLMNNGGVFQTNKVVKYVPSDSVTKLEPGDRIALTRDQFERLADAFFAELEAKFR